MLIISGKLGQQSADEDNWKLEAGINFLSHQKRWRNFKLFILSRKLEPLCSYHSKSFSISVADFWDDIQLEEEFKKYHSSSKRGKTVIMKIRTAVNISEWVRCQLREIQDVIRRFSWQLKQLYRCSRKHLEIHNEIFPFQSLLVKWHYTTKVWNTILIFIKIAWTVVLM